MRYLSVCSGIEAASVAWHPLGWSPHAFAEIEAFPSAVLAHHYPDVRNYGDMTKFKEWPDADVDVLVGGTPCQSFSVAGLRKGLADPRGNLCLTFLAIVDKYHPAWVVWENVPGVLSSGQGRDFGSFLGGLGQLGYGWCYRVLDAQYVRVDGFPRAVPQRRRRVFVVGYLGDWRRAAAVLFEREGMLGDNPPRREAGQRTAPTISSRPTGGGGLGTDFDLDGGLIANVAFQLTTKNANDRGQDANLLVSASISSKWSKGTGGPAGDEKADGFDASEDGTGRGTPLIATAFEWQRGATQNLEMSEGFSLTLIKSQTPAIVFSCKDYGADAQEGVAPTMRAMGHAGLHANAGGQLAIAIPHERTSRPPPCWPIAPDRPCCPCRRAVRRLMPVECERLQGFPDGYTDVPYRGKQAADGPRYKALGNSMAVNVMRWIGRRIEMVENLSKTIKQ